MMKMLLAALVLVATAAPAQADDARVTRTTLPNGIRVLVRENPSADVVAVSVLVRAGARFESADDAGVTNLLHRVMVRGTTKRSAADINGAAEDFGGSIDASGDVEYAEIRATGLARHWEAVLDLVAEIALQPSLPAEAVETERRLTFSQIQTRFDTPFPRAFDAMHEDLYAGHPYASPSAGRKESVGRLTREQLMAHYGVIYRPGRLVIAVSGHVSAPRVVSVLARTFGAMAASVAEAPSPFIAPAPPATPAGGRRVIEQPAQQAQVFVGFAGPGVLDADYATVKMLGAILGGGMSGRLFVELRDKLGLAYSVAAINPSRAGPAPLLAFLGTAPASAEAAEAGMLRELERIRGEAPTAEELARARAYLQGTQAMDRRTNARQAWYLAFFELIGAGYDFPDRYAAALDKVTPTAVQAAARRYLQHPTIVVLRPR
jgi:predicted Zn-dependent peptidase